MRESRAAVVMAVVLAFLPAALRAQNPPPGRSDSLSAILRGMTARIDSLERGLCPGPPRVEPQPSGDARSDSVAAAIHRLAVRLEALRAQRCARPAEPVPAQPADTADDLAGLRAAAAAAAGPADSTAETPPAAPTGPRGGNLLNPEISATGDVRLVARDESPQRDNGVAREFEFSFQSDLDPYSKTKIFLTFEDEVFGVEEGYVYWTGLPGRIRADLGLFRQHIGDLNRWHLHALPEGEYPLVYQRFFGEEGLSGVGVSLYTTLPVSIAGGTHEVTLQGTTAQSEPLYGEGRQPTLLGRIQNFWQLNRGTYAQLGFTATGGNNSEADLRSRLMGLDFRLTYRPPETATRRDVTFRAEGYRLHASELEAVTNRYGYFLDLQARTSRRWIFGARYDWVEAPRGLEDTEWRITPAITWWQSEFVFLRLQGEHRHSELTGTENLLSLQAVWAMGPHKHETY
jgi:hypothetical protein